MQELAEKIKANLRTVPGFPKEGINFYDITPLLANGPLFREIIFETCAHYSQHKLDLIVGIEARGFLFGPAMATQLGIGFAPARKAGKLPSECEQASYTLEYGEAVLEMHKDALKPGSRVLVVDDLLATGGTAKACGDILGRLGAEIVSYLFIIELLGLPGRESLEGYGVQSLVELAA